MKDKSGDRRFISILVNPEKQEKHPVTDLTQEYIDQLWGEAVWFYKHTKNPFQLSQHEDDLLRENREQFMYTTSLEDELDDVLENTFPDADFIANTDLAHELLGSQDGFINNRKASREVRYYMQHKGWDAGAQKRIDNRVIRGFRKLKQE